MWCLQNNGNLVYELVFLYAEMPTRFAGVSTAVLSISVGGEAKARALLSVNNTTDYGDTFTRSLVTGIVARTKVCGE